MATRLQNELNRLVDSRREGEVSAVITLYDLGIIPSVMIGKQARYEEIFNILTLPSCKFNYPKEEAEYWLDFFGVKPQ